MADSGRDRWTKNNGRDKAIKRVRSSLLRGSGKGEGGERDKCIGRGKSRGALEGRI